MVCVARDCCVSNHFYFMNQLSESGYLGAVKLERVFPRRIAVMVLGVLIIICTLFICAAAFAGEPVAALGRIFSALAICLAVYVLFTEKLQRDKNLGNRLATTVKEP